MQRLCGLENLRWPRADPVTLGQHSPAHDAARVDEKLRGPRDIMSVDSLSGMDEIIRTNRVEVPIGKKSKSITGPLCQVARLFGSIDADRHWTNAHRVELIQILLNTPQLGVARRSPVASIEN